MKIRQIRNATCIIEFGEISFLVDPMLCRPGALPGFRMFRGKRQPNPLVALPEQTLDWIAQVDGVILTHQHPDHIDPKAKSWIIEHQKPLLVHPQDFSKLAKEGLPVQLFEENSFGLTVQAVRALHGPGLMGWLMGKGTGWFITSPHYPSVYITGDTIYTPELEHLLTSKQPDVVIAPAGAANFGIGPDILFPFEQLLKLASQVSGTLIFNHLEALDHCLVTRGQLQEAMNDRGYSHVQIPYDGALVEV